MSRYEKSRPSGGSDDPGPNRRLSYIEEWRRAAVAGRETPRPVAWLDEASDYGEFQRLHDLDRRAWRQHHPLAPPPGFAHYWGQYVGSSRSDPSYLAKLCRYFGMPLPGEDIGPGERSGRMYRLIDILGAGGQAVVYRVIDPANLDGQRFALKIPLLGGAAPRGAALASLRERAHREARLTLKVQVPGIVPVYDYRFGEAGAAFYVMYLVEGARSLDQLLLERRLSSREAVDLVRKLACIIQEVHLQGIVHRDIKPANVLMHNLAPLLSDFGLAMDTRDARESRPAGTPHYAAPESFAGILDPRTDIYGLGAILFELLTGRPPFSNETHPEGTEPALAAYATRVRSQQVRWWLTMGLADMELKTIVLGCLQAEPRLRPTAKELAEQLERYLRVSRVLACIWPQPSAPLGRRPFLASAAAAALGCASYRWMTEDHDLARLQANFLSRRASVQGPVARRLEDLGVNDRALVSRIAESIDDRGFLAINADRAYEDFDEGLPLAGAIDAPSSGYEPEQLVVLTQSNFYDLRWYRTGAGGTRSSPARVTMALDVLLRPGSGDLAFSLRYYTSTRNLDTLRIVCQGRRSRTRLLKVSGNVEKHLASRGMGAYDIVVALKGTGSREYRIERLTYHLRYCGGFDPGPGQWAGTSLLGATVVGQLGILLPAGAAVREWDTAPYKENDESQDADPLPGLKTGTDFSSRHLLWSFTGEDVPRPRPPLPPDPMSPPYLYGAYWGPPGPSPHPSGLSDA
jgi:serine/threonine protein kinase